MTISTGTGAAGTGAIVTALPSASDSGSAYREPPHNLEAEQGLLGAILANNRALERVSDFLEKDHFADPVHGRIYDAARTLVERGQIANPVTLKTVFDRDEALADIGGAGYLMELAASAVTVINAQHYGHAIHELFLRRELIAVGEDMVNDAHSGNLRETAGEQVERAEERLFRLTETGQPNGGFVSLGRSTLEVIANAQAAFKRDSHVVGVTTGLREMDRLLGGLHPSDLVILAARPSMGKTSLATNISYNAARVFREFRHDDGATEVVEGARVAYFSMEMSSEQLAGRILAERVGISSDRIRRGEVAREDFEKFVEAANELERIPFYIDDTPALTVGSLRTRARRLKRQKGLDLIVVDYLQLMRGSGSSDGNRVQEISEISRGLKAVAKELSVPVLALSQLSRAVEQREDKRPQLSDLRESGSIEQDADVVMFIFREQYYLERAEPQQKPEEDNIKFDERHDRWKERCDMARNLADINVAKQRHGPIGTVRLYFRGEVTKFEDYVADDHMPEMR